VRAKATGRKRYWPPFRALLRDPVDRER